LAVVLGVVAPAIGFLLRRYFAARRSASLEHIRRLELENREIDAALDRMAGRK
jgi:hypothetical protein